MPVLTFMKFIITIIMNYFDAMLLKKLRLLEVIIHQFWHSFTVYPINTKVISLNSSMMIGVFDLWIYHTIYINSLPFCCGDTMYSDIAAIQFW